jgi:hypothetical protein
MVGWMAPGEREQHFSYYVSLIPILESTTHGSCPNLDVERPACIWLWCDTNFDGFDEAFLAMPFSESIPSCVQLTTLFCTHLSACMIASLMNYSIWYCGAPAHGTGRDGATRVLLS